MEAQEQRPGIGETIVAERAVHWSTQDADANVVGARFYTS